MGGQGKHGSEKLKTREKWGGLGEVQDRAGYVEDVALAEGQLEGAMQPKREGAFQGWGQKGSRLQVHGWRHMMASGWHISRQHPPQPIRLLPARAVTIQPGCHTSRTAAR